MSKRRSYAEIEEVNEIHHRTFRKACEIEERVNGKCYRDADDHSRMVKVDTRNLGNVGAEHQRAAADWLVVSFMSRDAGLIEALGRAMRKVLDEYQGGYSR